jgi:adenosylcobinamide-GDP ribazoletransferase
MKHLKSALQFLTILPLGSSEPFDTRHIIPYFPLVGLVVGFLLAVFDRTTSIFWPRPAVAAMDVIFLAAVTGAFHLDGLADAADGMMGHRSRERALEIMKDSRVGAMGLVTVVCCLMIKWAGLMAVNAHHRFLILMLIPAYARSGMLFGMRALPYGRPGGTAFAFFENPLQNEDFRWMLLLAAGSFFLGWRGLWLNLAFGMTLTAILLYYRKRMGCITGDMLGAMTELTETILFLMLSAGWMS